MYLLLKKGNFPANRKPCWVFSRTVNFFFGPQGWGLPGSNFMTPENQRMKSMAVSEAGSFKDAWGVLVDVI